MESKSSNYGSLALLIMNRYGLDNKHFEDTVRLAMGIAKPAALPFDIEKELADPESTLSKTRNNLISDLVVHEQIMQALTDQNSAEYSSRRLEILSRINSEIEEREADEKRQTDSRNRAYYDSKQAQPSEQMVPAVNPELTEIQNKIAHNIHLLAEVQNKFRQAVAREESIRAEIAAQSERNSENLISYFDQSGRDLVSSLNDEINRYRAERGDQLTLEESQQIEVVTKTAEQLGQSLEENIARREKAAEIYQRSLEAQRKADAEPVQRAQVPVVKQPQVSSSIPAAPAPPSLLKPKTAPTPPPLPTLKATQISQPLPPERANMLQQILSADGSVAKAKENTAAEKAQIAERMQKEAEREKQVQARKQAYVELRKAQADKQEKQDKLLGTDTSKAEKPEVQPLKVDILHKQLVLAQIQAKSLKQAAKEVLDPTKPLHNTVMDKIDSSLKTMEDDVLTQLQKQKEDLAGKKAELKEVKKEEDDFFSQADELQKDIDSLTAKADAIKSSSAPQEAPTSPRGPGL